MWSSPITSCAYRSRATQSTYLEISTIEESLFSIKNFFVFSISFLHFQHFKFSCENHCFLEFFSLPTQLLQTSLYNLIPKSNSKHGFFEGVSILVRYSSFIRILIHLNLVKIYLELFYPSRSSVRFRTSSSPDSHSSRALHEFF